MKDYFGAFGKGMAWNAIWGAFVFAPDKLFGISLIGGIVFIFFELEKD